MPAPPGTSSSDASTCARLIAALPEELDDGVRRRHVSGDATRTAAWGDPPITLRCGVAAPDSSLQPIEIDGLKLVTVKSAGAVTWTTVDRRVTVTIVVPTAYEEQIYVVQPLVPALKALPSSASARSATPSPGD